MNQQQKCLPSIFVCLLLDMIGLASFAIPGLGEFSDLIWAPLSGVIFYKLFGGRFGLFGGWMSFAEEILPFTDFIPSFTIAWAVKYFMGVNNKYPHLRKISG